jgi:hypothetical protein
MEPALTQKLLAFFYGNRSTMDTAEGLSQWIGGRLDEVTSAADALVGAGVLAKRACAERTVYTLAKGEGLHGQTAGLLGR